MQSKILITGGTGLIGRRISETLIENEYKVRILTRTKQKGTDSIEFFAWDPDNGTIEDGAFDGVSAVIHLAGAGIADERWSRDRKKVILDSRVNSAGLLYSEISKLDTKPEVFISSSGIGYYGYDTGSILVKEGSRFGDDFLATVVKKWEAAADEFSNMGLRVVKLRTGLVLSKNGGAYPKLTKPVKMNIGAALGSGEQYMSWIHIDDLAKLFVLAVSNSNISGVYNAVAPEPVSNKQFMKALAAKLKKPFFLPNVPGFVLKLALGEMTSMLTGGNRVSNEKIEQTGFKYDFPSLDSALENLVNS